MSSALIGYTGFVGSNLLDQENFTHRFNRSNIASIAEQPYAHVVCAGVQAQKWWANQNAEADWDGIAALQKNIENVKTDFFTLISTVDVYTPSNCRGKESTPPATHSEPYGRNRLRFEAWVKERFANTLIVRLPALYGPHLKKNIIFDLLTNNQIGNIVPNTRFQWYDMRNLSKDIAIARKAKLGVVNLMPQPLDTARILQTCFPDAVVGAQKPSPLYYDVCTQHGALFGGNDDYIATADQSLAGIQQFVNDVRAQRIALQAPNTGRAA